MPRTKQVKQNNMSQRGALADAVAQLKMSRGLSRSREQTLAGDRQIADIVSFCNSPHLLDLPGNGFNLFTSQKVVLKAFYMGTLGNENLSLDKEEWDWLYERKDIYETECLIEKIKRQERTKGTAEFVRFQELTLVLGRRSSKTAMTSIIAAYEAYKVLMVGDGDPHTYYNIPHDKKIAIVNVACAKKQAGELWDEIKARVRNAPFFRGRIEDAVSDEIYLFTDRDLKKKEESSGNLDIEGSIILRCGHSNPKSLRGGAVICLMFDELAFYDEAEKVSGKGFFEALAPSVAQFAESGYDSGVIVEISSPGPRSGHFFSIYDQSLKEDSTHMLSLRMPTWLFNPRMTENNPLLKSAKFSDEASYMIEYGAEWPEGGQYGVYFPKELVDEAFNLGVQNKVLQEEAPRPGCQYYAHVDPSATGANFVCAIVRKQVYKDQVTGLFMPRVILSNMRVWIPQPGVGLDFEGIEAELLVLFRKFRPVTVSHDQYPSDRSNAYFARNLINMTKTPFTRFYKERIFLNLKELMMRSDLWLFDHPLLHSELTNLRFRFTPRGRSIGADPRGDVPTDDTADCLAGASFMACTNTFRAAPLTMLVRTGFR